MKFTKPKHPLMDEINNFQPQIEIEFIKTINRIAPIVVGLNLWGAPSGIGKTTLQNSIVVSEAIKIKNKGSDEYIVVVSTEQSHEEAKILRACFLAKVDVRRVNKYHENPIGEYEFDKINTALYEVEKLPIIDIYMMNPKHTDFFDYRLYFRKMEKILDYKKRSPKLVIFDYLQNVPTDIYGNMISERQVLFSMVAEIGRHARAASLGKYSALCFVQLDETRFISGEKPLSAGDNVVKYSRGVYHEAASVVYYFRYNGEYRLMCVKSRFTGLPGQYVLVGMEKGRLYEMEPSERDIDE